MDEEYDVIVLGTGLKVCAERKTAVFIIVSFELKCTARTHAEYTCLHCTAHC